MKFSAIGRNSIAIFYSQTETKTKSNKKHIMIILRVIRLGGSDIASTDANNSQNPTSQNTNIQEIEVGDHDSFISNLYGQLMELQIQNLFEDEIDVEELLKSVKTKTTKQTNQKIICCTDSLSCAGNEITGALELADANEETEKWKILTPGLSAIAKCWNENCVACGNEVTINFGFGVFNSAKCFDDTKCPCCKNKLNNTIYGLSDCNWMYGGLKVNSADMSECNWNHCEQTKFQLLNLCNQQNQLANLSVCVVRKIPEQCAICLDEIDVLDVQELPCAHSFHSGCIKMWLQKNTTCPCCRIELNK